MRTLILHIGTMKTGSSALQQFFQQNCSQFASQGFYIPYFPQEYCYFTEQNGLILSSLFDAKHQLSENKSEEYYYHGFAMLKRAYAECETVLLTSELLSAAGFLKRSTNAAEIYANLWHSIHAFCNTLYIDRIRVVVYLRRQDALIASLWKHLVRSGSTKLSFEEFLLRPIIFYLDYEANLRVIESAMGPSCELVVRKYDRSQFYDGDIYHDFCHAAGIPWDADFALPESDENSSITFDVAEAMREVFNHIGKKYPLHENVLFSKALELSRRHPDPPATTPFTSDEARVFMDPFQQGNSVLAKRFFSSKPLFPDTYDQPQWVPNEQHIEQFRNELLQLAQTG